MNRVGRLWVGCCLFLVHITAVLPAQEGPPDKKPRASAAQDVPLINGDFAEWTGDTPQGWTVEIGAHNGADAPTSRVQRGESPGLQLVGNAQTLAWRLVRQTVALQPGQCYRLRFSARAVDVRREGQQYDNCYVGLFFKDAQGKSAGHQLANISQAEWLPYTLYVRVPQAVAATNLMIFLSKSGMLEVREFELTQLQAEDSFQILVDEMDRNYSHFEFKQLDWAAVVEKFRPRAEKAKSRDEFVSVLRAMLGSLQDIHTWIAVDGQQLPTYRARPVPAPDFTLIDRDLQDRRTIGKWGVVGRTAEGWGYVRITSLIEIDPPELVSMLAAIEQLFDAPGMIVDLRANVGGAESVGQQIASLFADASYIYARQRVRNGPAHSDFVETEPRRIGPRQGSIYSRPVACLVGPGAISSAEGMALMMKSLPHCTLFGQPTRGASGNPAPVVLPNGVDVYFSRWVSLEADGTPIEGRGVAPDVVVESVRGRDAVWEQAKQWLAGDHER